MRWTTTTAASARRWQPCGSLNPLHLATARVRLPVCRYLVEELGLDVNASDINKGASPSSLISSHNYE
jgi:hypothetical protein